jgi:hypothetical protein
VILVGSGALAAVQLLPGFEYLALTTRAGFGFDAKGNGFPLQDLTQFVFPGIVSVFSPLYVGVSGLGLAVVGVWRRAAGWPFWLGVTLVALVWSLGANSVLYPLLYNVLPGLYPFRGQERAAFLVANALAILAGLGAGLVVAWRAPRGEPDWSRLRETLYRAFLVILGVSALAFVGWVGFREAFGSAISAFALAAVSAGASALLIPAAARSELALAHWGLVALLVFELFTVSMTALSVYDHVPADMQLPRQTPQLIAQVLADTDTPFRVDGFRGLTDNYGSFYGVADIRGISPLWLDSAHAIIEGNVPDERAWEVFAVRYVFTDWMELPVPSTIVGQGVDRYGPINLHRLEDPRPFAHLIGQYEVIANDTEARARLADPSFDARNHIVLNVDPAIPQHASGQSSVDITSYKPEDISLAITTDRAQILSVALVDYPGWHATIDEEPIPIMRAYGALMAVVVPPGATHIVRFTYDPATYRAGALVSLAGWAGIGIVGLVSAVLVFRRRRTLSSATTTPHRA